MNFNTENYINIIKKTSTEDFKNNKLNLWKLVIYEIIKTRLI